MHPVRIGNWEYLGGRPADISFTPTKAAEHLYCLHTIPSTASQPCSILEDNKNTKSCSKLIPKFSKTSQLVKGHPQNNLITKEGKALAFKDMD